MIMHRKHTHKLYVNPGFTLAEVLLTLAIIGIIASLTIPDLITSVQTQQYSVALKKNYSVLSAATKNLQNNYETIDTSSHTNMKNDYKKVLTFIKEADALDENTYPSIINYYKGAFGATNAVRTGGILTDGTLLLFWGVSSNCTATYGSITTVCGSIGIDINGIKLPNTIGLDYFEFLLYKSNGTYVVTPEGSQTGSSCVAGSSDWDTSLGCTQNVLLGTPLP